MKVRIDYKPKYQSFMDLLLKDVIGPLAPDEQVPTERALIYEYGLSYSTVSRALKELEREGHIYRVQGKGTFKGSGKAPDDQDESRVEVLRKLSKDTVDIGVVFFDIANATGYMVQLITGLEEACRRKSCDLHVYTTRGKTIFKEYDSLLKSLILSGQIDGLVLASPFDERDVFSLIKGHIPFVVLDAIYRNLKGVSRVSLDCDEVMRQAMEYLTSHGYKHCGLIVGPMDRKDSSVRRPLREVLEAAQRQASEYGISMPQKYIKSGPYQNGQAMMDEIADLLPPGSAVITDGDIIYQGALRSLASRGLDPNRDVLLFNVADTKDMIGTAGVRKPLSEMGEAALELLHEMIRNGGEGVGRDVLVKPSSFELA